MVNFSCAKSIEIPSEQIGLNNYNSFDGGNRIFKRSILKKGKYEWEFPIVYFVDHKFKDHKIDKVLKYIEKSTCLAFIKTNCPPKAQLEYKYSTELCCSPIGRFKSYLTGRSDIYLKESCSKDFGLILHETLHALGLSHEHQRVDRDRYIEVFEKNFNSFGMKEIGEKDNQDKFKTFSIRYDYSSIMHYATTSCSRSFYRTMQAKNIEPFNKMMGQHYALSFNDIKLLNSYYCHQDCKPERSIKCKNGGYHSINSTCFRCICPKNFDGNDCKHVKITHYKFCKKTEQKAQYQVWKHISEEGFKNCHYLITAEKDYRVHLKIKSVRTQEKLLCAPNLGLEIKYLDDKGVTGLCLCGIYSGIDIISE
uniref:Metalloendopeptidase n=1 Tax=Parastrongyloides trichosuri TaxID=131310 RepID=A0A0N4Z567_PARTI